MTLRFTFYRDDASLLDSNGEPHAITPAHFAFLTSVARNVRVKSSGGAWIGVLELDELGRDEIKDILSAALSKDLLDQLGPLSRDL